MSNLPTAQPTSRDILLQLAQRCEAASGPDRELDADIAEAYKDAPDRLRVYLPVPRYSDSLDAALSLVPEGWRWEVGVDGEAYADAESPAGAGCDGTGAATPALALCAAALRARAALA